MICKNIIQGRIAVCLVVMTVIIYGRLTWCIPHGAQILFLDEPLNASFDSFESHYSDETFTINTVGCVIPAVDIDVSKKRHAYNPKSFTPQCRNYKHRLLVNNQTHIWTMKENFEFYNICNESNFECCYKSFYRPYSSLGLSRKMVDHRVRYLDCIMFRNFIEVNNEFVKVNCSYNNKIIYNQYFIFTPKKQFTYNRENPFKITGNHSVYNIIIMGLGSMSRQNFFRTMPKTSDLLKKYNAVELKGYNTLADNTFDNMIPVLVGMNASELYDTCWPHARTTLDSCPFIWDRFKDMGYYTALAEDTGKFGMFNQGKFGFRGSPTDYYLHPFISETENMTTYEERTLELESITNVKKLIKFILLRRKQEHVNTCMGDKYYFEVLLNYIESLTKTLRNSKLFGLFWETSMSHDNLNDPVKMDSAYVKFLRKLYRTDYLNDTILIFLSDHGMNNGDIRLTKQGRIEQRLPFIFILVPPSFRNKYQLAYHNLKANKGRLTTPFDVHKTLVDLIHMSDLTDEEILRRNTEFYTLDRGVSLFLQIPRNRTCEVAGISNQWCTCYNDVKLASDSPILMEAINFLTQEVNDLLEPYPDCLKLIVDGIIVAKEMLPVYEKNSEWRDINLIVRMAPGGGIFETMLRISNNNQWTIIDHVKRLNFPGFRSFCVDDANLKLFCYCK